MVGVIGTEWGSLFFSLFFWIGVAVLLVAAIALRLAISPPREPGAARRTGAARLVHTIRRGRVRLSIWASGGRAPAEPRHQVQLDRRGPDCGDCVDCMNQALRWIREREASA